MNEHYKVTAVQPVDMFPHLPCGECGFTRKTLMELDKDFWESKYQDNSTGWDIGFVSTPIKEYIDQLDNKDLKILIPGAGNSYEGEYLHQQGFKNVWLCDLAPSSFANFRSRVPDFPEEHLLAGDFFELAGGFDLILEQTFFCALDPTLRPRHAQKMHELLKPGGRLVGLLFDAPLNEDHPPFGGNRQEYLGYFEPLFLIQNMDPCYNSIEPRAGRELFINLQKA